ncbi:SDR family oxidoreductase [Ktedonobacter racemifer]|uniref:NmrA family protein n=1 Tax=Ktedonobacter racemifer DSM 44963 TaxID=485913 RepID=D6U177_KTERA|nr:SDR family oxidoreductase [Ktedonobacter racemifer]EFH82567.1 NmrA family protein [Ktedonobacter racemifer DSM 44963]
MKIVVIGGCGLIGKKLVKQLRERDHQVMAASPSTGVNTITGEGLAQALVGAQVVVNVANAPVWEDKAVLEFFETSGRNLLAAEAIAGVGHHVALSVVGADRLPESGYLRAKVAQEHLIKASQVPYTILRATQFFEFVGGIAQQASDGQTIRLSPAFLQPILSDDVVASLADVTLWAPLNGTVEVAGPEQIRLDELVRRFLSANNDTHEVITDVHAHYERLLSRLAPLSQHCGLAETSAMSTRNVCCAHSLAASLPLGLLLTASKLRLSGSVGTFL